MTSHPSRRFVMSALAGGAGLMAFGRQAFADEFLEEIAHLRPGKRP